jgi:plasmid maintenance system antidote protein VapI
VIIEYTNNLNTFSKAIGLSIRTIQQIYKGDLNVSPDFIPEIIKVAGGDPEVWSEKGDLNKRSILIDIQRTFVSPLFTLNTRKGFPEEFAELIFDGPGGPKISLIYIVENNGTRWFQKTSLLETLNFFPNKPLRDFNLPDDQWLSIVSHRGHSIGRSIYIKEGSAEKVLSMSSSPHKALFLKWLDLSACPTFSAYLTA